MNQVDCSVYSVCQSGRLNRALNGSNSHLHFLHETSNEVGPEEVTNSSAFEIINEDDEISNELSINFINQTHMKSNAQVALCSGAICCPASYHDEFAFKQFVGSYDFSTDKIKENDWPQKPKMATQVSPFNYSLARYRSCNSIRDGNTNGTSRTAKNIGVI
jgi:hypothetical protein